jgi:hypothetical protein
MEQESEVRGEPRPPSRPVYGVSGLPAGRRRPEIFVSDRVLTWQESFLVLAAASVKQIKFDTIMSVAMSEKEDGRVQCEGTVIRSLDLIYEISFLDGVQDLRVWLETNDNSSTPGKVSNIVDMRGDKKKRLVKRVVFDPPIYIREHRYTVKVSYVYDEPISSIDFKSPQITPAIFSPKLTAGLMGDIGAKSIIVDDEGSRTIPALDRSSESIKNFNVRPTIYLRDGSIYDKNVVDVEFN